MYNLRFLETKKYLKNLRISNSIAIWTVTKTNRPYWICFSLVKKEFSFSFNGLSELESFISSLNIRLIYFHPSHCIQSNHDPLIPKILYSVQRWWCHFLFLACRNRNNLFYIITATVTYERWEQMGKYTVNCKGI